MAVSGATGFVGGLLCAELEQRGWDVAKVGRTALERFVAGEEVPGLLEGCVAALHLAGRAHVLREVERDRAAIYRAANRDTTLAFASACVRSEVNRFVFLSSIHVNGSRSERPFRPEDLPLPGEPYAASKLEAEQGLWEMARQTGLEVVVVRPPLVYGPGAKANVLRLLQLAALPVPLPLAGLSGKRSLIGVWNLVDLLIRCIDHRSAPGHLLLAADSDDIALPELVRVLSRGMGRHPRLFKVPEALLARVAAALGQRETFEKLAGTLQVDASETRRLLDWSPPVTLCDGLTRTARWYVESRGGASTAENTKPAYEAAKRLFDIVVAGLGLAMFVIPMAVIALAVAATSRGPVLYWSDRTGRGNSVFRMPKFRSMYVGTPPVATHLLANANVHVTPVGRFLRLSSLDELPQLWSVLTGDMSLVGPRPALFNQDDLIEARTAAGVHELRPGITGWAQVNGRDELPIPEKVALDTAYLRDRSFLLDLQILFLTAWKVVKRDGVAH